MIPGDDFSNTYWKTLGEYEQRDKPRRERAGSLIGNALRALDSLPYLVDIAAHADEFMDHRPQIKEIAHVRWACTTAITALDLCAAALAREFGALPPNVVTKPDRKDPSKSVPLHEKDLRDFHDAGFRSKLSIGALAWADGVLSDPRYENVAAFRKPFTHAVVYGGYTLGGATRFSPTPADGTNPLEGPTDNSLLASARDLTVDHVVAFMRLIETL